MSRKSIALMFAAALLLNLGPPRNAHAGFTFTYTGTFDRDGVDHAQLQGATFTMTVEFPMTAYVDFGIGVPVLESTSKTFSITGAPNPANDGDDYILFAPLLLNPNAGGALQTPSNSDPLQFTRPNYRLAANLREMFGGDGLSAGFGDLPQLSHFPTSLSNPFFVFLPANIDYNVLNASMSVVSDVPEPSTLTMASLAGILFVGGAWRRHRMRVQQVRG